MARNKKESQGLASGWSPQEERGCGVNVSVECGENACQEPVPRATSEPVADGASPLCSAYGLSFDQRPLEQDRVEDGGCVLGGHWDNVSQCRLFRSAPGLLQRVAS